MPASKSQSNMSICVSMVLLALSLAPSVNKVSASTQTNVATTNVNILLDYGNGTLVWYNNTSVPSGYNYYNVTTLVTGGNLGVVFFASFGSHFVYSINGAGCPASNIFCDAAWSFWTLDGICWDLPFVGVDLVPVSQVRTVAWLLGPAATFGESPPTGSNCLQVSIEVKPGDNQTVINVGAGGVTTVAILSTSSFDATRIAPMTVRFGRTGTEASPSHWAFEDVNHDGLLDLVLKFPTQTTGIQVGDTQATLMGRIMDGAPFRGTATIRTISH